MKKLAMALLCLVSVAFFASCSKEGQPSISVLNEPGYVQDGETVTLNEDINFGFVMTSSPDSDKELSKLVVKIDGEQWAEINLTGLKEYTYRQTIAYDAKEIIIGESEITATVTDKAGEEATASIKLYFKEPAMPLVETAFEWVKIGHNVADLSEYGLEWKETNWKDPFTHIVPATNCTLFVLEGSTYAEIETDIDLVTLFSTLYEGTHPDEEYKVDVNASATYDDLLITKDADGYLHAIYIDSAKIESVTAGTKVTITGKAK